MKYESQSSVKDGDVIAVWFSCGAASAVAAKRTLDEFGDRCEVRVLNNPIKEELADNQRFLRDVGKWLNVEIEHVVSKKYPNQSCVEVWDKRKFMSSPNGAPCTVELKKQARQDWEKGNHVDWHVLGFTAGEEARHNKFTLSERDNVIPVLIEKQISKGECFQIIKEAGIELPENYRLGYPNANCIGCVKATSPTYWNHVRKVHPEVFRSRADQSKQIGAKLVRVNNIRIPLHDLDPLAQGRPMKDMNFECGIFCEESAAS